MTATPHIQRPTLLPLAFKRIVAQHWRVQSRTSQHDIHLHEDGPEPPTPDLYLYETFTPECRHRSGAAFVLSSEWLNLFNPHGFALTRDEALHALCWSLNMLLPSLMTPAAERTLDLRLTPLTAQMIRHVRDHRREVAKLREIIRVTQNQIERSNEHLARQLTPRHPHSLVTGMLNHHFRTVPGSPLRVQWAQRPDDLLVLMHAEDLTDLPRGTLPWGEIRAGEVTAPAPDGTLTSFMGQRDLFPLFITPQTLLRAQTDADWLLPRFSAPVRRTDVDAATPLSLSHLQVRLPSETPGRATLLRDGTPLIHAALEGHTVTHLEWAEAAHSEHPAALAEALLSRLRDAIPDLDHRLSGEQAEHWFRFWVLA